MDDVENVGIMQGFLDKVREEEDDLEEEEDSEEGSSARMLDRKPDSPEILMNNLRGDMRSVDARREELADLVGYKAAAETPDSVLAMLQPVLAQGAGLGALPQSGPMAQGPQAPMPPPPGGEMGMPPQPAPPAPSGGDMAALLAAATPAPGGGMAPGGAMMGPNGQPIPPEGMPPIQMSKGGFVQRFKDGSEEEAVAPSEPQLASSPFEDLLTNLGKPKAEISIDDAMQRRMAQYEELGLAPSTQSAKANILFDIAGAALGYAANRGPGGEALSGDGLGRFAAAFSALPAAIQKRVSDIQDTRRQLSLYALEASEKEQNEIRDYNARLQSEQNDILVAAIREQGANARADLAAQTRLATAKGGPLSSKNLNYMVSVLPAIESGQATDRERVNFIAAYDDYTSRGNPIVNPADGRVMGYEKLPIDPRFTAAKALAVGGTEAAVPAEGAPSTGAAVPPTLPAAPGTNISVSGVAVPPRGPGGQPVVTLGGPAPITAFDILDAGMVGPDAVIQAAIGTLPFEAAGEMGAAELTAKDALTRMTSEIRKNIDGGSRILKAQYEEMARAVDLTPKFFNNVPATVSRFAELSLKLRRDEEEARRLAEYPTDELAWQNSESFDKATRQEYARAAAELGRLQRMLNMPDVFIGRDGRAIEAAPDLAKRYAIRNKIPLNTPFVLPMLAFSPKTGNWEVLKEQASVSSYE